MHYPACTWALAGLVILLQGLPGANAFGGASLALRSAPGISGNICKGSTAKRHGSRNSGKCAGILMSNVMGVASNEDIMNVVQLAKRAMPNRPDGVVVCVQYSNAEDVSCMAVDAEFDRLSEAHLDCIFMRCYAQYEGADTTMALRDISSIPTFEVFYRGDTVAKIRGAAINEVQQRLQQYGFVVSKTDLFGQSSVSQAPDMAGADQGKDPWEAMADQAARQSRSAGGGNNPNAPVRTTMRYYPGGMGGLGQTAADTVREKGSSLDEWQSQRGRRREADEGSGSEAAPRGVGAAII